MRIVNIERVMHSARRVMRRNIERLEIVIVVFNFWALNNIETHGGKECLHALNCASNWMQSARLGTTTGERHINGLGCKLSRQRFAL